MTVSGRAAEEQHLDRSAASANHGGLRNRLQAYDDPAVRALAFDRAPG